MEDDGGLGIGNWGYYDQSLKGNLGRQLMSGIVEQETKPFFTGRCPPLISNGGFVHRDFCVPGQQFQMDYLKDSWNDQREKHYPAIHGHQNCTILLESLRTPHPSINPPPPKCSKNDQALQTEDTDIKQEGPLKKGSSDFVNKTTKSKSRKGCSNVSKEGTGYLVPRKKAVMVKKNTEVVINGIDVDISCLPTPICSCTGMPTPCYRWGCGGWQSACCTSTISNYPLPVSTKRRGSRIAGRKMSQGAFKKVLEKLAAEGYNLSNPIDLKAHWAKHDFRLFLEDLLPKYSQLDS